MNGPISRSALASGSAQTGLAAATENEKQVQKAALQFFDRPAPPDYISEWAERIAQPPVTEEHGLRSVVLFRMAAEWLALDSTALVEVTDLHPVHTIPHRTGQVLRGLVNIRGQLRICVSLHGLLGVEPLPKTPPAGPQGIKDRAEHPRMLILQDRGDQWTTIADEVIGVWRLTPGLLRKVPSTFAVESAYCQAVFDWQGITVGYLDQKRLVSALRSLLS